MAIFQLKKNSARAVMVVAITEPISSGIQWEDAVSNVAQSLIMGIGQDPVRSRWLKNDKWQFADML